MKYVHTKPSRIFTLVSALDMSGMSPENLIFLERYFVEFNKIKRRYARLYSDHLDVIKGDIKRKDIKDYCDPEGILPYRVFRGVEQTIKGLAESQQSNRKNYIENTKEKIKQAEKRLKKDKESLENLNKTTDKETHKIRLAEKIPQKKKSIYYLKNRIAKLNKKLDSLQKQYDKESLKVCFGGAKRLKKRHSISPNDKQSLSSWQIEWFHSRHDSITAIGDAGDSYGNSNMQVSKENGQYFIKIIVPSSMRQDYSFSFVKVQLHLGYRQDTLDQHIMSHELKKEADCPIKARPMTVMLKKDRKGNIKAHLTINDQKPETVTSIDDGAIGVDINADHLAISETDRFGNFVSSQIIPYDLSGTTGQNEDILSHAVQRVIDKALETSKNIVIEDLDFRKKKKELNSDDKSERNKKYNRMLSSLSYSKITELFASKTFRAGVELIKVNPANTSQIGKIKYQNRLNLTAHQSASYVIARRGQGFKEKVPKNVILVKNVNSDKERSDHLSCTPIVAKILSDKALQATSMSVFLNRISKSANWKELSVDELNAHLQSLPTRALGRWSVLSYNRECYLTY